jgi:hypothetical protein
MEDDDFWSSKSVSSSIKNTNVNDYDYGEHIDSSINTETKKIILPNLGYSNEDKSFYFKFNTIKEIDSFTLPKTVNIKLLNQYNCYIDDIFFNLTPLKNEYYDGLIIQVKYLKSKLTQELLLATFAKKIELYLLELPTDDEIYIKLGIKTKVKIENSRIFNTVKKNRNNKKYAIDDSIDNLIGDNNY